MDLSSAQSISLVAEYIQNKHVVFNVIVANASVGCDLGTVIPSVEVASRTLLINVTATISFIKQFLPILSPKGRIVVVSSMMGLLKIQSEPVQKLLANEKIT
jgi:short-subunit dehydrogenase involved in D-alanine esterification of teichoic acids